MGGGRGGVVREVREHSSVVLAAAWYGNFIYTRYFLQVHLHSSREN